MLDQAVHDHRNKGNNALLEVPLDRFRRHWPEASFEVLSISPHFCRVYIPGAIPISPYDLWETGRGLEGMHRYMPKTMWQLLFEMRERLQHNTGIVSSARKLRQVLTSSRNQDAPQYDGERGEEVVGSVEPMATEQSPPEPSLPYSRIADYDLYAPTGGGYMCDFDQRFLYSMFDRMEAAVNYGVPVVMVGQGIGPIEDQNLRARAREVLPMLDYIMIREERVARPLLDLLNVPQHKAIMTGDDAIELAYQARKSHLGTGIGLSLRVAAYTQVDDRHINAIHPVILQAARKYGAELIAAPIDVNEADIRYIEAIMKGHNKRSSSWMRFESTAHLINRISRCRIMITGTFHGAVFALGQGIPVIALAKSVEYTNKLAGLTTEFGEEGCQIINLNEDNVAQQMGAAIDFAWSAAERLRPYLLQQAKRQIDLGYIAYQKIYDLVEMRRQERHRVSIN
ncbi:MAG TPA: polysaccharide pyruvyl transferase family protein [Chloroflexota bacterium]|nr:polysaccharide pyruvyl transferase family protein [Chloroflexota bacterium]